MAEIKAGAPFGMDGTMLSKIDWNLALKRISHDQRTDFIYAPHLGFIYSQAGDDLIADVKSELRSGQYTSGLPLTIEVPKAFRIRIAASLRRLGPSFSRPGSILLPHDRLLYQALADQAAPIVAAKTDSARSFSHQLADPNSASMFLPTRVCWSALQNALAEHAKSEANKYILKVDVANFFGSLNLHTLINVLNDSGFPPALCARLEAILTNYAGQRSSRGILQGIYPSDLFGNYYLAPVDRFFDEYGVPSARYVDDLYVFLESVEAADQLLHRLIPTLRIYDLVLNENKSVLMPKSALRTEEPDLEALFAAAVEEISRQIGDDNFDADYGFQSEWEEDETDEEELELAATTILFDSLSEYPGQEENIERFCLPLFSKAGSDYALAHALDSFKKRPSMTQMYASYVAKFLDEDGVRKTLWGLLQDPSLTDWQKMWILAALSQARDHKDAGVKLAFTFFQDANRHDALRAVAAIFVGRFGDHARRKTLMAAYASVSQNIQAAIYFSSRRWPVAERNTAKATWASHTRLNSLITVGIGRK
jgi:Reverse transcriptase (RNA-dependent DNA polymerase)